MKKIMLFSILCFAVPCIGALDGLKTKEEYVAGVIYAETLGESDYGRGLVATVIWVRAGGDTNKFLQLCKLPKQFAKPQRNNDPEWGKCYEMVKQMYAGKFQPLSIITPQGHAILPDHFYVHSWPTPFWARDKWHKQVGKLCFLRMGKYRLK